MPRLFTGLAIPEILAERLASLRSGLPGARWLPPEDFHITLQFLGDVEGPAADDFAARLEEIHAEPFTVEITELGSFGGAKPHALWAGVKAGAQLSALQRAQGRAARLAGLAVDARKFAPHVTLARLRGIPAAEVAEFLETNIGFWGSFGSPPFEVSEFLLYSARPGSGGGPYVIEERYLLGGRSTDREANSDAEPELDPGSLPPEWLD